ncbi:hypothetical protein Tco_1089992 [Tanacetum coccineum]|uniref:Uncharacterized protein n=1 Tax=Tanacetum coccineum TaxID=301880 RepID=A0ABQ5I3U3_9ASTR
MLVLNLNLLRKLQREKFGNQQARCSQKIRYTWRPTGRTFTIVGNACPLTRITTTAEVLPRKPTALETNTSKHVVTLVYSQKSRKSTMKRDLEEKQDLEEIEMINIELDHRVSKLIAENEHLKQTYKQFYDSIKPTRIRSKEQCDALIT